MDTEAFTPEWAINTNNGAIILDIQSAGDALKALRLFDPFYYDYLMQHCRSAMIADQKKQLATYFGYIGLWAYVMPSNDHIQVYSRATLPAGSVNSDLFGDNVQWNVQMFLRSLQPFLRGHIQLIARNNREVVESYVFDKHGDCHIYQGHHTKVKVN